MTEADIARLLRPYLTEDVVVPPSLYSQLAACLELLLKWNAKTNLTAIRDPEEIVCRHFGESIFAAQHLSQCETLLDFGSGAGFPGLPIQLFRPELRVTLAESQNKKASFLREATRVLNLQTEVWAGRVEAMPEDRRFDIVALRAVDDMVTAISAAVLRAERRILLLTTSVDAAPQGWHHESAVSIPGSLNQQLIFLVRN